MCLACELAPVSLASLVALPLYVTHFLSEFPHSLGHSAPQLSSVLVNHIWGIPSGQEFAFYIQYVK